MEESNETNASDEECVECSEPVDISTPPHFSYSIAVESVNNLIKWCQKNDIYSTKHMSNLLSIRTDIVHTQLNVPKNKFVDWP